MVCFILNVKFGLLKCKNRSKTYCSEGYEWTFLAHIINHKEKVLFPGNHLEVGFIEKNFAINT